MGAWYLYKFRWERIWELDIYIYLDGSGYGSLQENLLLKLLQQDGQYPRKDFLQKKLENARNYGLLDISWFKENLRQSKNDFLVFLLQVFLKLKVTCGFLQQKTRRKITNSWIVHATLWFEIHKIYVDNLIQATAPLMA